MFTFAILGTHSFRVVLAWFINTHSHDRVSIRRLTRRTQSDAVNLLYHEGDVVAAQLRRHVTGSHRVRNCSWRGGGLLMRDVLRLTGETHKTTA